MEEYSIKDKQLYNKFKEFMMGGKMDSYSRGGRMYHKGGKMWDEYDEYPMHYGRKHRYMHEGGKLDWDMEEDHFDEQEAKAIVAEMFHVENDKKYVGEKYSPTFAKTVFEKNKAHLPEDTDYWDVYVAINAQYHDYAKLFHKWFGSSIDTHIVDSAIMVWFKDDDYDKGNKIFNYFEE